MARTPLAAFFNIPIMNRSERWGGFEEWEITKDFFRDDEKKEG